MPDPPDRADAAAWQARLAAVLRADAEHPVPDLECDAWVAAAEAQGVLPLLAARLGGRPASRLSERLGAGARAAAAADIVRERALRAAVGALADAGVTPLVIKGAHLAYSCYARPDLRPRTDTDLLIAERERPVVDRVLRGAGHDPVRQVTGDLLMYQAPYAARSGGVTHLVDVHWRLANAQRFGDVLAHDEVLAAAEPLVGLHLAARGPAPVHALIIACVHRTAHHFDEPRLIWLYDIHLLAARLDGRAWADLVAQASARQVAAVCRNGLTEAVASLGTAVPRDVLEALSDAARSEAGVQAYAGGGRTQARRVADDLRAVGSWRRRWRLVGQHLFPPARYMREVYAPGSRAPLAALYARRAWRGARRWLRSS